MDRRSFLTRTALGSAAASAAATIAAPAIAQSQPTVKWRLTSSFPKSLDAIYGGAELISRKVAGLTDGKFTIQVFAAGEIMGGLQALDGVQNATVEAGHTMTYYYIGKDPTSAFSAAIPFGLNSRHQVAWMSQGGGMELMNEFWKQYNVFCIPAGNTAAQMGGWFRREIKTVEDLKGLKFRVGGLAGQVLSKLGVIPQQIPAGDIYPALERGVIDAAEWLGPYDDEKLGLNKVARYYYYPGWWEGTAQVSMLVNLDAWNALPAQYKLALETACEATTSWMMARYDALSPPALRRLAASGTEFRAFPREVMEACYRAALELYDELAASNPNFKKVYEPWRKFMEDEHLWFRVAEHTFDTFMYSRPLRSR
ncbi:TRAP transporter substrate-binding protein [Enterovirga sp.]|uniref:TRAP transporter substrate-binding protein n=1 Tax=Enterovirga sp. TaxID=2026350 RepID=UPI0026322EC2|nr:TRAP transporter substrate-binding protein [Enterovirga sp.]MDB5591225.1 transporter substrate-binding protein [Enterovirga sp.]